MKRRTLLGFATATLVAPSSLTRAQAARVYRVAWLAVSTETISKPFVEAFLVGLRDHGYVVGRNLEFHIRYAGADKTRLLALADELIALKPDVLVGTEDVAVVLKQKTATIPIVLPASSDPVAAGLVQSFARPGTNVTGLSYFWDELTGKHVELLVELVPKINPLACLSDGNFPVPVQERLERVVRNAGTRKGLSTAVYLVRDLGDVRRALAEMESSRPQGLIVFTQGTLVTHYGEIIAGARRLRLPAVSGLALFVNSGGLISYGPDFLESYRYVAKFVDRILKGASPAELAVEQSTKFELAINLKGARELGLDIPQALLVRADRVIE